MPDNITAPLYPAVAWNDFRLDAFGRGRKHRFELQLSGPAKNIRLPVLLARGAQDGPVLAAIAGVHGDEFEGPRAIMEVFGELDPSAMSGDMLAVVVANPPAFWAASRTSPLDRRNLARTFPGDLNTDASSAIAWCLAQSVIRGSDFLLDLHTAGVEFCMPLMVGFDAIDTRSLEAALSFGAPVIWGHPRLAPGRTISFASECGIPWLYTEGRGGGRIEPADLRMFRHGLWNLLHHLKVVPQASPRTALTHWLCGSGDLDAGLTAPADGLFVPCVEPLDIVEEGSLLGDGWDLHGERLFSCRATSSGTIAMVRARPVVQRGDPLLVITQQRTLAGYSK